MTDFSVMAEKAFALSQKAFDAINEGHIQTAESIAETMLAQADIDALPKNTRNWFYKSGEAIIRRIDERKIMANRLSKIELRNTEPMTITCDDKYHLDGMIRQAQGCLAAGKWPKTEMAQIQILHDAGWPAFLVTRHFDTVRDTINRQRMDDAIRRARSE